MKNVMKRVVVIVMCCVFMVSSLSTNVGANTLERADASNSEFDKIDELHEVQVEAMMKKDWQKYEAASEKLEDLGCEEISYGELLQLTCLDEVNGFGE